MWFQKKVKPVVTELYLGPVHNLIKVQVARIHFYLPNDVIILPVLVEWDVPYGPISECYLYNSSQLFNQALNNYRVREGWFLFNDNFYPESSIRLIQITDINKLYVKEI